jgi:hypothetical protein
MNQALVRIILRELLWRVQYHEEREPDDYKHCPAGADLKDLIVLLEADPSEPRTPRMPVDGFTLATSLEELNRWHCLIHVYKGQNPATKRAYELSFGGILNAYREGDLSFFEAKNALMGFSSIAKDRAPETNPVFPVEELWERRSAAPPSPEKAVSQTSESETPKKDSTT